MNKNEQITALLNIMAVVLLIAAGVLSLVFDASIGAGLVIIATICAFANILRSLFDRWD